MPFYIVGTAGHIDHGKTELSKALTGIQTDRLREEQDRGMSIKLGFAPLDLTPELRLGLVDVPGHEKFIQQMLSGASGMDLVILVIAATEGIMPQTREHLDIISLLGIQNLVVALTKKTLVDEELLELVLEDTREFLKSRGYHKAPIIPVDSITGEGLPELRKALRESLETIPVKEKGSFPRLPIDRVFTLAGHGTIVTGTLWSGKITKGDYLTLFPMGKRVKVRNLQVHGVNVESAVAGQRVAINIPDAGSKSIPSGQVLLKENILQPTFKVTGLFTLLPEKGGMSTLEKVRVHLGTGETLGKLVLLEADEIFGGQEMLAALYLEKPLGTVFGDHLILRRENASETLGGFRVIEATPQKIRKKDPEYLENLRKKLTGTLEDQLIALILEQPFIGITELQLNLALEEGPLKELLKKNQHTLVAIENCFLLPEQVEDIRHKIETILQEKAQKNPLSLGVSKEEIKSKLFPNLGSKIYNGLLKLMEESSLAIKGDLVQIKGFQLKLNQKDEERIQQVLHSYKKDGFSTKTPQESAESLGMALDQYLTIQNYLINLGQIIKIDESFYLHHQVFEDSTHKIIDYCLKQGSIDITEAREILGTSRKYIVPYLEYLDYHKWTKRMDNKRILLRRNYHG